MAHHYLFQKVSMSNQVIVAKPIKRQRIQTYTLKRETYPDIAIPNRSFAWHLFFQDENAQEKVEIKKAVEEYNSYLLRLESCPDFLAFFVENGLCVTRAQVSERWSEEFAEMVFSKKPYPFHTDLRIIGDNLVDVSCPINYGISINGSELVLPIGKAADAYPKTISGRTAIWNWVDSGHDFGFYLWQLLGERYSQTADEEDENAVCYSFDAYDQFRDEEIEPQLKLIFYKLEDLGYIETYTIKTDHPDPRWSFFGKSDSSIDLTLVDCSFRKNKLLMEQIELLLWQPTEQIKGFKYVLTDSSRKQYLSDVPGRFGGHQRLKIYGRLDCPSAQEYLAKGMYKRHRVFFADEITAIKAGYRPCAVCMPEAYKRWKEDRNAN